MINHVDIILVIPLAIGAIRGFSRGFILEIASLVGIVAGVFLAALFANIGAELLMKYIDWNPYAIKILAFVIVFILVMIVIKIIARMVESIFKLVGLNIINRIAGLGAGVLKVAFILSVVLIFFNYINRDNMLMSDETRKSSFLYNKVAALVPSLLPKMNFINFGGSPEVEEENQVNT